MIPTVPMQLYPFQSEFSAAQFGSVASQRNLSLHCSVTRCVLGVFARTMELRRLDRLREALRDYRVAAVRDNAKCQWQGECCLDSCVIRSVLNMQPLPVPAPCELRNQRPQLSGRRMLTDGGRYCRARL